MTVDDLILLLELARGRIGGAAPVRFEAGEIAGAEFKPDTRELVLL